MFEVTPEPTVGQLTLASAFALGAVLLALRARSKQQKAPLPPGPKPVPILGNSLQIPEEYSWLKFKEWQDQFGDIISLSVLGPHKTIIVLNTTEDAVALLDKRGSNYSERPTLAMIGELMGWNMSMGLSPYDDRWKAMRKAAHQFMGTQAAIARSYPDVEKEARRLAAALVRMPEKWQALVRSAPGTVILRTVYGYETRGYDDPLIELADEVLAQFSDASRPGAFVVDMIPILKYVPEWFPGAGFKVKAREWRKNILKMTDTPLEYAKKELDAGRAGPSFVKDYYGGDNIDEDVLRWAAVGMYGGASDTTVASLTAFFLAMTKHPEVMKKAQEELQSVVGSERLPTFEDRGRLPYIEAMVKEVTRWHVVGPLGLPHCSVKDDVYKGYLIPGNSLIMVNIWSMLHDPAVYKDPEVFRPERFLGPSPEPDPTNVTFGFGRRVCPGRLLAEATMFVTCATLLTVFDISKPVKDGRFVEPVVNPTPGVISHPGPFSCVITPRSERAVKLVDSDV